jgi:hypothetical protein
MKRKELKESQAKPAPFHPPALPLFHFKQDERARERERRRGGGERRALAGGAEKGP